MICDFELITRTVAKRIYIGCIV